MPTSTFILKIKKYIVICVTDNYQKVFKEVHLLGGKFNFFSYPDFGVYMTIKYIGGARPFFGYGHLKVNKSDDFPICHQFLTIF